LVHQLSECSEEQKGEACEIWGLNQLEIVGAKSFKKNKSVMLNEYEFDDIYIYNCTENEAKPLDKYEFDRYSRIRQPELTLRLSKSSKELLLRKVTVI
jgi:hypothetical protein